jgi:2-phosphosulfolactate phosphatase
MQVQFFSTSREIKKQPLASASVAVIDVLRATTTMTAALAAGARGVVPCGSVRAARAWAARAVRRGERALLAGERGGVRLPGFDLGNSPLEFTRARVAGRRIFLATSNGTKALAAVGKARRVVAACIINVSAAARALWRGSPKKIFVLAAGELGAWSEEDALAAGLLLRKLCQGAPGRGLRPARDFDRPAKTVYALAAKISSRQWPARLRQTPHGRDLVRLGFQADIPACARLDATRIVGELSRQGLIQRRDYL